MAIIGLAGGGDGEDAGATAADTAARLTEGEEERRPIVDDPTRVCGCTSIFTSCGPIFVRPCPLSNHREETGESCHSV